ncbi:serine/threonine-protein kinase RsbW [Amycolatopsis bartoniae]|uniref:Anti-sigma factor n=1 Tax=Amycolatopsis bartoniae TaxID=941986 RepID=A0A8H9IYA7_9PSEU|nr:ATP-binding protein [Amycolatopsis bartoniae]MBB2933451.1 serine/threonine-protein kinase RsbW [Amycolatopsis bartoniae]TVT00414.1 ATP-binding protein [Amycolatopsis bartoniae]GHF59547.1 anti-sigma factor [Amycolatopsis bartoniae]
MADWEPPRLHAHNDIELWLGADLVHLPIVRSVVATIATRADFDLDAIADLRLAVDEACSTLITRAVPGSSMRCRFTVSDDELRFTGTVHSESGSSPSTKSFGWRVLTTLTDSVDTHVTPNGQQGHQVDIELAKRRIVVDVPGAGA